MGSNDGHRIYQGGQIIDGDYCDSCSNEAYEVYIKCWGESECLYQDEDGLGNTVIATPATGAIRRG